MLGRICALLGIKPTNPSVKDGLIYLDRGPTVPTDGTAGYGVGCIFQHTDGSTNTAIYVNEGSATSCDFNSGGTSTLLSATAGVVTASKAVVVDSNKDAGDFRNLDAVNLDLGASGTAGTLDIFPSTASKGKLNVAVTDQTGNTTVSLLVGAMAAARTIGLPDPLADADILTGKQAAVARTATADGTTTGTIAAAGRLQHITVTSSNAAHIVVLPTPTPGTIVTLWCAANGFELQTSTPASIALNGGTGAAVSSTIAAGKLVVAICVSATVWLALGIASDGTTAGIEAAH